MVRFAGLETMMRFGAAVLKALVIAGALIYVCELLGLRVLQEAGGGTTGHAAQPPGEESVVRTLIESRKYVSSTGAKPDRAYTARRHFHEMNGNSTAACCHPIC
jgi:hypothetical protein